MKIEDVEEPKHLILGVNGFIGRNFYQYLKDFDPTSQILGLDIKPAPFLEEREAIVLDIFQPNCLRDLLRRENPSCITHCIGSYTRDFDTDFKMNALSTKLLLEGVSENLPSAKVLLLGTSAEYGESTTGPMTEGSESSPANVYGLTKKIQTDIAQYYFRSKGIAIVTARIFNAIGPHCPTSLFIGNLISQLYELKKGTKSTLELGPLDAIRDYVDVRDIASAMYQILHFGKAGRIYNVGSGLGISPKEIVTQLLDRLVLDRSAIKESGALTSENVFNSIADIGRIKTELAWQPKFSISESIDYIIKSMYL